MSRHRYLVTFTARVKVTHHDDQRDASSWEVTVTW